MGTERTIKVRIVGRHNGSDLSLSNFTPKQMEDYMVFIRKFFHGDGASEMRVSLEPGSVKVIVVAPALLIAAVAADIAGMKNGTGIADVERARALKEMQGKMYDPDGSAQEGAASIEFMLDDTPAGGEDVVTITKSTPIYERDAGVLFSRERTTTAMVVDMGGIDKANVHLSLADGTRLVANSTSQYLGGLDENFLYKKVRVRVRYRENSKTGKISDEKLVEIIGLVKPLDEDGFRRDVEDGTRIWADVDDPVRWVRDLRG